MRRRADRERDLGRVRRWVERGSPRLAMSGMVSLTAAAGFLTSVLLLHSGVDHMALRWLLGAAAGYVVFLLLLRLWLLVAVGLGPPDHLGARVAGKVLEGIADEPGRAYDLARAMVDHAPTLSSRARRVPLSLQVEAPAPSPGLDLPVPDLDLDLEGCAVVVVAIVLAALAAAAVVVSAWLVWVAPSLLAELAFVATLGAILFRSLRGTIPVREPWRAALRHTWGPALLVTVTIVSGALVLEHAVPGARSLREVAHRVLTPAARAEGPDGRGSR